MSLPHPKPHLVFPTADFRRHIIATLDLTRRTMRRGMVNLLTAMLGPTEATMAAATIQDMRIQDMKIQDMGIQGMRIAMVTTVQDTDTIVDLFDIYLP